MNEKALIKKCQKGEKSAYEELIRLFYPYVSGFLLKSTGDELLTQDLTQDTFMKMICGIDSYSPDGKAGFGTWLITIAKNCYIDYLRRNRIYPENIEDIQMKSDFDIFSEVYAKTEYEEILQAIKILPPEQGIAIRMKYEEEMTLAEIGERFGVPSKTVKSRIHDGTVKLRKILKTKERNDVDG